MMSLTAENEQYIDGDTKISGHCYKISGFHGIQKKTSADCMVALWTLQHSHSTCFTDHT